MKLKTILSKLAPLSFKNEKKKIESDDSYCYANVIWNTADNLIMLISFTEDHYEHIIDIQDAMNYSWQGLCSKIVYSSYDEEVTKEDENGKTVTDIIVHKKHYMLIGGEPSAWQGLYFNICNLSNPILDKITEEIHHNCDATYFRNLIDDGIFFDFYKKLEYNYNTPCTTKYDYIYTDPKELMSKLPTGFTGKDILKFIKIQNADGSVAINALKVIEYIQFMNDNLFRNHYAYPIFEDLYKEPTVDKLKNLLEPLYKQMDDDSIPGDVSDESLDEMFREHYEKFSAVADNSIQYEDIDEELADDEESENIHTEDVV